ncbi:MAG: hypothetical protein Q8865_02505 [Bacillota bacterium]|nr:hypothetical protein [Bacillota bacterium]
MKHFKLMGVFLCCLLLCISFASCSSNNDKRTMDDFIKAYQDAGITVDKSEKPFFSMIGAIDGVIFDINGSTVKIYQYKDIATYEKSKKDYNMISSWPVNGVFVLESTNAKATEIFNSVKRK